jgi:hypothetical protein
MPKVKIPKRVGGVKIPKKVRKKANKAIEMADSPAIRELAAAAIGAAAGTRRTSRGERDESAGEPLSAAATIRIDANRFGEAFRNAALDGFRRFLEGFEEGLRDSGAVIDGEAREKSNGAAKKATRPSPGAEPA